MVGAKTKCVSEKIEHPNKEKGELTGWERR